MDQVYHNDIQWIIFACADNHRILMDGRALHPVLCNPWWSADWQCSHVFICPTPDVICDARCRVYGHGLVMAWTHLSLRLEMLHPMDSTPLHRLIMHFFHSGRSFWDSDTPFFMCMPENYSVEPKQQHQQHLWVKIYSYTFQKYVIGYGFLFNFHLMEIPMCALRWCVKWPSECNWSRDALKPHQWW